MLLKRSQILPALLTNGWKRIAFLNRTTLGITDFKNPKSDLIFRDVDGEEIAQGNLTTIFKFVKSLEPECSWCSTQHRPATAILPDGFVVCDECFSHVHAYYLCEMCGVDLPGTLGTFARDRFERKICGNQVCQTKWDIKFGRICCEKAVRIPCVCERSYKCPVHCPQGVHIGTHD